MFRHGDCPSVSTTPSDNGYSVSSVATVRCSRPVSRARSLNIPVVPPVRSVKPPTRERVDPTSKHAGAFFAPRPMAHGLQRRRLSAVEVECDPRDARTTEISLLAAKLTTRTSVRNRAPVKISAGVSASLVFGPLVFGPERCAGEVAFPSFPNALAR